VTDIPAEAGPPLAPALHGAPPADLGIERFRTVVASLDLGYALIEIITDEAGRPVDYRVLEHNDAMERHLGVAGPGSLASELTPGIAPAWVEAFAEVAVTGIATRLERYEPSMGRWFDTFALRVGTGEEQLVAVVFRDVSVRHRNAEMLRQGRERHAFLLRLMDALRPLVDPAEVQAAATRLLAEHLGADRVFYALVEPDGDTVVIRADQHAPDLPDAVVEFPSSAFGPALMGELQAGRTIVVGDLGSDDRMRPPETARTRTFHEGAAIGVPLVKDGRWVAVLSVHSREMRAWTTDEVELVEETAERTWASVERAAAAAALAEARRHLDEERERTLTQERAARHQAEAATRMRDEFLASVSHELRTPLAAILLWSRLMSSGRVPGREREALAIIEANAEAQRLLVDDLLDASRAMAGTLSISVQRQPVGPVAEEAVRAMRPLAEGKGVEIEITVSPVEAVIDGARIGQVVRNLLDNAIRHTPSGGTIRVSAAGRGRFAELAVTDSGSGIDQDLLPHIFDRFRRGSATEGGGGALGLGLSISREIVGLHKGTLSARSDGPGTGATFTVRLPAAARAGSTAVRKARVHRPA
jgi:signal transduction histidine kinase